MSIQPTPTTARLPGEAYAVADSFQNALDRHVESANDSMLDAWVRSQGRTRMEYDLLLQKIAKARELGQPVSAAWLYQKDRLANTLRITTAQVDEFARYASAATAELHAEAIRTGAESAAAMGDAALHESGAISSSFTELDPDTMRRAVGFAGDGSPLFALFSGLAGDAALAAREVLVHGVTTGKGIDWMKRRLAQVLDVPRWRAETIARTEAQRIFRAAHRETYMANADLMEGWTWKAHLDQRTCSACVVMDGTLHPVTATLDGHPRCRCAMVPRTKSWEALGSKVDMGDTRPPVRSGKDWLAAQPDAVQRAIMGRGKHRAYKDGQLSLDDLVARTESPAWGTMRRERSLREIREGVHANTMPSALRPAPKAPQAPAALAPEPAYVDKLTKALDSGDLTVDQLSKGAETASELGQVNAREAIRQHLARQEAQAAARAARGGPLEFRSAQEARDWADGVWAGPDGYPEDELKVLRDYTASAYGPMNNTLRSGKGKRLNEKIRTMDRAMDRAARVPDDIQVIRNANLRQLGITASRTDPKSVVGRVLEEHGYLSTSINRSGAMQGEVRLAINVPKGSKAVYVSGKGGPKGPNIISDYGGGESELILDRGGQLTITRVRKVGNRWHVEADWKPRVDVPEVPVRTVADFDTDELRKALSTGTMEERKAAQVELVRRVQAKMAAEAEQEAREAARSASEWVRSDEPMTWVRGKARLTVDYPLADDAVAILQREVALVVDAAGDSITDVVRFRVPAGDAQFKERKDGGLVGGYVQHGGRTVYLNPKVAKGEVEDMGRKAAERGHFMPGAKGVGFRRWTIAHELGHVMDNTHQHTHDAKPAGSHWRKAKADGLSTYGASSRQEGYAEAWAQWIMGGPGSSPAADRYAEEYGWKPPTQF